MLSGLAAPAEIGQGNGKADILAWPINYLSGSLAPEAASISIALRSAALARPEVTLAASSRGMTVGPPDITFSGR